MRPGHVHFRIALGLAETTTYSKPYRDTYYMAASEPTPGSCVLSPLRFSRGADTRHP